MSNKVVRNFVGLLAFAAMAGSGMSAAAADTSAPHVNTALPTPVQYPAAAQAAGEQGTVVVQLFIDGTGAPSRYSVVKSSGFPDLDLAALETAMNWHYVPAQRDGGPVSDWTKVSVVYTLPK